MQSVLIFKKTMLFSTGLGSSTNTEYDIYTHTIQNSINVHEYAEPKKFLF